MKRQIIRLLAATTLATGMLLVPTAAQAASGCTTLYDGRGGNSRVCKSWTSVGGGYYKGTWSVGVTTSYTYVQKYQDGKVSTAAKSGSYSHLKKFYLRACDSLGSGCSAWW
ncbi:hypothetical protein [Micromonospora zhanjiangensis]|uniref:Bacteriocin (Lactococcin_972) n=1 Tax=Micromonospora zhanjiangensis TaxID=1522057 RepID=A0ABV8KQR2_9ACTN